MLAEQARALAPVVQGAGALLFINDRLDVAMATGADGVHLGPDDLPIAAARGVTPSGFIIGASTDDPGEAQRLVAAGADYIGCGTVYHTSSKADAGSDIGLEGLSRVVRAVDAPVVGIGGITPGRAADVAGTGAAGLAAIGALTRAEHIGEAVRTLLRPWSA